LQGVSIENYFSPYGREEFPQEEKGKRGRGEYSRIRRSSMACQIIPLSVGIWTWEYPAADQVDDE